MAKFENEGYCPCNTVAAKLLEADDNRLIGLWSLIGPSVVCTNSLGEVMRADAETVIAMFSEDPIAYRLMQSIIAYSNTTDKIRVFQNHKDGCNNMQNHKTILEIIQSEATRNPVLVVENQSQFVAVLVGDESKTVIDLYMWDLANCW